MIKMMKLAAVAVAIPMFGTLALGQNRDVVLWGGKVISASGWSGNSKKASSELSKNPKLKATLSALLPPDTDLKNAAKGFGQVRQFATTVHVAKNMSIPFSLLKSTMTDGSSKALREAIAELRPIEDASAEVKKAEQQANEDMKEP